MPPERRGSSNNWVARKLISTPLTARRSAAIISMFTLSLTVVSGVLAFLLDRGEFPNLGVSMWWAVQTVTTVGYGDFVPRNTEGRIIGAVVMLGGISFVAVVTASIAAALVESARHRAGSAPAKEHPLASRLEEIVERLERLERAVERSRPAKPDEDA